MELYRGWVVYGVRGGEGTLAGTGLSLSLSLLTLGSRLFFWSLSASLGAGAFFFADLMGMKGVGNE